MDEQQHPLVSYTESPDNTNSYSAEKTLGAFYAVPTSEQSENNLAENCIPSDPITNYHTSGQPLYQMNSFLPENALPSMHESRIVV